MHTQHHILVQDSTTVLKASEMVNKTRWSWEGEKKKRKIHKMLDYWVSNNKPETQKSCWHHRCMLGCPDLKGCAWRRPTRESLLDCNAPPKHDTAMRWRKTSVGFLWLYITIERKDSKNSITLIGSSLFFFFYLVWLWSDFLFKPLEGFVVFSLMHSHLL